MSYTSATDVHSDDLIDKAVTATAIAYWLLIIAYALTYGLPRPQYTILFIGGGTLIYLLHELTRPTEERAQFDTGLIVAIMIITVIATIYLYIHFYGLFYERSLTVYWYEFVLAVVFTTVIGYLSYREFGLAFLGVAIATLIYGYFGSYFPGIWTHGGLGIDRLMNILVLDIGGIFGTISRIVAAWVALFLLYAGLLRGYGAFDLILRISYRMSKVVSSGVAQSAVAASIIIGSINGSQTANAAMTGSFTIPMMKESGLSPRVAAGIESVASTGGQIMPPVMGAAAFVMAALLGISYLEVIVAGLLPAVIFIVAVAIAVHYATLRSQGDMSFDEDSIDFEPKSRRELIGYDGAKFGIPFAALIYLLGIAQWTIMRAALATCLLMIVTGVTFPIVRSLLSQSRDTRAESISAFWQTVDGFRHGAVIIAPIVIIIAVINGIVDILLATGMPGVFSLAVLELSGGVLLLAALAAMAVCIVLGLGMPTVAAYTIVSILIAPTFVNEFLLPDLAAHFFVLYAAILSGITPPIAVSVVVATGIAGSNFWKSCFESVRIGASLFILPIVFVYNTEIVVGGITAGTLFTATIVLAGALTLTHGLNYVSDSSRGKRYLIRTTYFGLGVIAMVHPNAIINGAALLIAAVLFFFQYRRRVTGVVNGYIRSPTEGSVE